MGMATQGTLKDVAMGVDEAWEESYRREAREIERSNIGTRCDGGNAAIIRDGDKHVGLESLRCIDVIWGKLFHKVTPHNTP
jgi:hypothetical protein